MGFWHRAGAPAVIDCGERRYYRYGSLHNFDGPAVQSPERTEWWLFNRRVEPFHPGALALILAERRASGRTRLPPELWPLIIEAAVHVPALITAQPAAEPGRE